MTLKLQLLREGCFG